MSSTFNARLSNNAIFAAEGFSARAGRRTLADTSNSERTFPHKDLDNWEETRGCSESVFKADIKRMEAIIEAADVEERLMTWEALEQEAQVYNPEFLASGKRSKKAETLVSGRTVQRVLGRLDYHTCVACQTSWVSKNHAAQRLQFAKDMLAKYPTKYDWRRVRFSDEVHFGLGPQGKLMIIRKKGQRYCANCLQEEREPCETDKKKLHAWAAFGYNFKLDLVFYDIPSNTNGKMTYAVYLDILREHVVPWVQRGDNFVLEEDRDTSHGISKKTSSNRLRKRTILNITLI